MRAPVKNTSLKSLSPVSWRIGLISMPGWSSGQSRNEMPRWPRALGSVRASRKIQLARCATEVHTFCPSITQSAPSSAALVDSDARSEPAPGSEKPWHHRSSPDRMRGRNRRLLLPRAPPQQRAAEHLDAEQVGVLAERDAGQGQFLHQHHLVQPGKPASAVLRQAR